MGFVSTTESPAMITTFQAATEEKEHQKRWWKSLFSCKAGKSKSDPSPAAAVGCDSGSVVSQVPTP